MKNTLQNSAFTKNTSCNIISLQLNDFSLANEKINMTKFV